MCVFVCVCWQQQQGYEAADQFAKHDAAVSAEAGAARPSRLGFRPSAVGGCGRRRRHQRRGSDSAPEVEAEPWRHVRESVVERH